MALDHAPLSTGGRAPAAGSRAERRAIASVVRSQAPADQHRDLHRLLVVQARIHLRLVRAREVRFLEPASAADAFGDVVAGELEVPAAEHAALFLVDPERGAQLGADVVEAPGL